MRQQLRRESGERDSGAGVVAVLAEAWRQVPPPLRLEPEALAAGMHGQACTGVNGTQGSCCVGGFCVLGICS